MVTKSRGERSEWIKINY